MNNWIEILNQKSLEASTVKESEILINLPSELLNDWDNFMRGKTCPIMDDGDHGVFSWDLSMFLNRL
jgi:hypothetical protein